MGGEGIAEPMLYVYLDQCQDGFEGKEPKEAVGVWIAQGGPRHKNDSQRNDSKND